MNNKNEFYLRDMRNNTGSSCMFWAKQGKGYTTNLNNAEIFNFEEAQERANRKDHFIPLCKESVDSVSTIRVDMQELEHNADFSEGVAVRANCNSFDGNDIFFVGGNGEVTANYSEAKIFDGFNFDQLMNFDIQLLSKRFLDTICRPTIQFDKVNHRKMIRSVGIKYRAPRKKKPDSGKTRKNCGACGKILWDYDPYCDSFCDFICERNSAH